MLSWWVGVLVAVAGAAGAFCPEHCSCFTDPDGYVSANCSVLALDQVTQSSPVEMLSLHPRLGGYATPLKPRAFLAFQKVKFLWAVNCSILNLPTDVFHGLHFVIRIDLSFNKIRHLNGAVFKSLGSLTTLKLRSNPLELTPWDVIVSDSLQEIDMGYCGLRTIPYGTFISVPRLSRLYLDGNELSTFTYNTIPAGLRYLNLARNKIRNVPTEVLTTMVYLKKLDLSKNPINCTCTLLIMQDWFSGRGIIFDNGVTCVEPSKYKGMRLNAINENEFCTLEEVERQRRINHIQSYRDSKIHRTDNMIHDRDLQSDQPNDQMNSEVLFHDDATHGLTHMELSDKHYPVPSDLSDENNKVATSKQGVPSTEVDIVSPTQVTKGEGNEESSKEESQYEYKETDSHEVEGTTEHSWEHSVNTILTDIEVSPHSNKLSTEHTTNPSNWNHSGIVTTDINISNFTNELNATHNNRSAQEELADEGYSVFNMSDIMMSDGEEGSGGLPLDELPSSLSSKEEENSTSTPKTFTFPSSHVDYLNYDSHHDYSGEVTTEAMTTFSEEGSGDAENETVSSSSSQSLILGDEEENETTTENYIAVENSTHYWVSSSSDGTSEDNFPLTTYSSSSEVYTTDSPITDESTTENMTEESPIFPFSSTEASSSESSVLSSTTEESVGIFDFSSSEVPTSSSESPTTSPEPPFIHVDYTFSPIESSPSSSEPTSTSTQSWFPVISTDPPTIYTDPTESSTTSPVYSGDKTTPTSIRPTFSSTLDVKEVEILSTSNQDNKAEINVGSAREGGSEKAEAQSTLTYVIGGLLLALILLVVTIFVCRKVSQMRPCASKKKVRLPQDTEANHGTEMQDMLIPKPPENGVKIISQNGHKEVPNGKEIKEEEVPVLQKDWDEKPEPIETVTARMSILAGPQTPVFIHKTLA